MKKALRLIDKNGREILGSDGMMRVDGRHKLETTKQRVRERNKSMGKHFPHLIATGFRVWNIGAPNCYSPESYSQVITL